RRAARRLQPDVELGADGNLSWILRTAGGAGGVRRPVVVGPRRGRRGVSARAVAARARAKVLDAVAQLGVLIPREGFVLSQLDLQIRPLVARIVELGLKLP